MFSSVAAVLSMLSSCGGSISLETAVSHGLARRGVLFSNFCLLLLQITQVSISIMSVSRSKCVQLFDLGTFRRKKLTSW